MPLCTNRPRIHKSLFDELHDTRHQTLEAILARESVCFITNIRIEYHISVAQVEVIIDSRAVRFGDVIFVERLRVPFVEIHQHRVLLRRVEVGRLIQNAFERIAIQRNPGNQLRATPFIVRLLLAQMSKARFLLKRGIGTTDIRIFRKTLFREKQHVRLLRTLEITYLISATHQLDRCLPRLPTINGRTFRSFVERQKKLRRVHINRTFLFVQTLQPV